MWLYSYYDHCNYHIIILVIINDLKAFTETISGNLRICLGLYVEYWLGCSLVYLKAQRL